MSSSVLAHSGVCLHGGLEPQAQQKRLSACGRTGSLRNFSPRGRSLEDDWDLVANKSGATRLGFGLLLKFFELEARFPRDRSELHRRRWTTRRGPLTCDVLA